MPSDYRCKEGINQTLAALTVMSPQPSSPGVQATRRVFFGDGSILDQGLYVEWVYSSVPTATRLSAILTPLGLMTARFAPVTIYTRDDLFVYHRYNGMAIRPVALWENYMMRRVTILIRNLIELP